MDYPSGVQAALQALGLEKTAELGPLLTVRPPGSPLGVSLHRGSNTDRLPGMQRYVPNDVIERTFEGIEGGLDPRAIMELEQARGALAHPALGAVAGGAATHLLAPRIGLTGKALGALAGATAGALYNRSTEQDRMLDSAEALEGVLRELKELSRDRSTNPDS